MKTVEKSKIKGGFVYLLFSAFIIASILPLKTQVNRDHSVAKKEVKVCDHRSEKQTINIDLPRNIIGTRAEIQWNYPELILTGENHQIMITKKLFEGENSIYKSTFGNTVYAIVKKGKVTGLSLRNPKIKDGKSKVQM